MKYSELTAAKQRRAKRVGRGIAAGRGKTAGRGTKGQLSRKSGRPRVGFEGGQTPLYMRLPHLRGFTTHKQPAEEVHTGQLNAVSKSIINNQALYEAGLLSTPYGTAKLLLKGDLKSKKDIKLQAASKAAITAVKKAGGSFTKVERVPRPAKQRDVTIDKKK